MGYRLSFETGGVSMMFSGTLSASDLVESTRQVHCHPDFDRFRWVLKDFLNVAEMGELHNSIEDMAVQYIGAIATNRNIRIAIVGTHPEVVKKMEAYHELCSSEGMRGRIKIFQTLSDAESWLKSSTT